MEISLSKPHFSDSKRQESQEDSLLKKDPQNQNYISKNSLNF